MSVSLGHTEGGLEHAPEAGWLLTTRTTEKRDLMKMLHIVCGKGFEEEIVAVFKDFGILGYTMISGVGGSGVTGTVSPSDISADADTNTLFMVALDFESTFLPQILDALRQVRAKYVHGHHDREIPLKVFLQPCEIIM